MEKINKIFRKLCYEKKLKEAKKYYLDNSNVILDDDINYIFADCCFFGNLKKQKWLLFIRPTIISVNQEYPFYMACLHGHLKIAKWLFFVKPTIDISKFNFYNFWCSHIKRNFKIQKYISQKKSKRCYLLLSNKIMFGNKIYNKKKQIAKLI